jgi:hypothetical protein
VSVRAATGQEQLVGALRNVAVPDDFFMNVLDVFINTWNVCAPGSSNARRHVQTPL